ncbi:MAG: hypothetical protein ABIK89_02045, partial [Planctomycetota bacterium]
MISAVVSAALLAARAAVALEPINDTQSGESLRYGSDWTLWTGPQPRGGTLHYANRAGSAVELTFTGSEVHLVHKVGPDCGFAAVSIDGKPAAVSPLDTYSASVDWNRRTVLAQRLPPSEHVVRIEVTGRRHTQSTNTYVQVVGFDVDDPEWLQRDAERRKERERQTEERLGGYRDRCPPIAFVKRHHFRSPGAGGVLLCW